MKIFSRRELLDYSTAIAALDYIIDSRPANMTEDHIRPLGAAIAKLAPEQTAAINGILLTSFGNFHAKAQPAAAWRDTEAQQRSIWGF